MTAPASPPTPVFICGVGRSGTTLLASLLDSHPALAVIPGQTHYFREMFLGRGTSKLMLSAAELVDAEWPKRMLVRQPLVALSFHGPRKCRAILEHWLDQFPDPPAVCYDRLDPIVEEHYAPGDCWDCFLSLYECVSSRRLNDKRYWVEKTPGNERFAFLSEITFRKTSRYLHIIRDPRAVVASRLLLNERPAETREHELVAHCHGWARSVHLGVANAARCGHRYRMLRYEDLVRDPRDIANHIAHFLDIEMTESMLTPTGLGEAHPMNSSFREWTGATPGVIGTQVERYAEVLAPQEISAIEQMLGVQMTALGYGLSRQHRALAFAERSRNRPLGYSALKHHMRMKRIAAIQRRSHDGAISLLGEEHGRNADALA